MSRKIGDQPQPWATLKAELSHLSCTDVRRRVGEYITAQYRQFSSKFGPRSLDAPLSADGPATLMDVLSTDAETGYWDPNMMASTGRRK
jgi:hypothetical protein